MNPRQLKKYAMLALLSVIPLSAAASITEYRIPATLTEFEAQWEILSGTTDGTWTWVDDSTPYAETQPVNKGESGATLVYGTPLELKGGEIYYIYANVCSADYNDEERFYIVFGSDKNNLSPISESTSVFFTYRNRDLTSPNFQYRPTDGNKDYCKITVSEDGVYWFGIRSWYGSGSFADKKLQCAGFKIEKDVNYPQKVTSATATADNSGKLETTLTWTWPSKNKDNSEISGTIGANIYRHISDNKSDIYKAENIIATIRDGTPGEKASFIDNETNSKSSISTPGKYYYYIAPFNDYGENSECTSSSVITCKWVGEDEKTLPPLNVVARAVGDGVEISWQARMLGYNGGWINPELFSHRITRSKNGGQHVTVVENYKGDSPYTDTELEGPGSYVYSVYSVYKDTESSSQNSPGIFAGGAFSVPFSEDFSDLSTFSNFTIATSSTSIKWDRNYSGYAELTGPYYGSADVALITPPLKLESGKTYKISCLSWVDEVEEDDGYGWGGSIIEPDPKDLGFIVGTEPSLTNMETISTANINKGEADKISADAFFSPSANGSYYFGFRCNTTNRNKIYLDNILIEESVSTPATISDLSFIPNDKGANKAMISFTIPDKTNAGISLPEITKVSVIRHSAGTENTSVTVKTLTGNDAIPGKSVSFEDDVPEAGMYAYSATCTLYGTDSETATTPEAWVGYDIPKTLSSFAIRAEINEKGAAVVTWPALSGAQLGKHNGYVDAENLRYRIYRTPNINIGEKLCVGESEELSFTDNELINAPWDNYSYGVSVLNGIMEGDIATNNKVAGGKVTEWPFSPDLTDDKFIESLQGRSFTQDNGLAFKNRGEQGAMEYIAYLPPFHSASSNLNYSLDLEISRTDINYEELLEIYLCVIERDTPDSKGEKHSDPEAVPIPGENERSSLKVIPVHALSDSPAKEKVDFTLPATGKYRLALKCASVNNKGLTIHSITFKDGVAVGINDITSSYNRIVVNNGIITLPDSTAMVYIYTPDGTMVDYHNEATMLDISNLSKGIYIVRVITTDNRSITAKIHN